MKIIKVNKIIAEEKETLLNYDFLTKTWHMDSTVQKHFNKAIRQGWTPLVKYEYDDGTAAGYVLEAPSRAVTIRNVEPKKLTDKQRSNLVSSED